jgi:hypothetical protein
MLLGPRRSARAAGFVCAIGGIERIYLVHGDEGAMQKFAERLAPAKVEMPMPQEAFEI